MITVFKNSKAVGTSQNLRGIGERIRRIGASNTFVQVWPTLNGARVDFSWTDESYASVNFASYGVACDWVLRRALRGAKVDIKPRQLLGATA